MSTTTAQQAEDLCIDQYRFMRNDEDELIKIPSATGLHGYLVIDSEENIYHQIRMLDSEDEETSVTMDAIWETIHKSNDSILFPEMLLRGTEDDVLFCVTTLPNGEPVERYAARESALPVAEASRLVARFAGRLRSQKSIPVEEYAIPINSVWLDSRSIGPRLILGDIAPAASATAGQENVAMCIELLGRLTGNPFETEYRKLVDSLKAEPGTLAHLENTLERYLDENPPARDFWTEDNLPRPILSSLISEKDIVEEIKLAPETGPVRLKRKGFLEKLKIVAGATVLIGGAFLGTSAAIVDDDGELMKIPYLEEKEKSDQGTATIPKLDEGVAIRRHDGPKQVALNLIPEINLEKIKKPLAYASAILLPEIKEPIVMDTVEPAPEFLKLQPLALLKVTPEEPKQTVAKRLPEFVFAAETNQPVGVNVADQEDFKKQVEKIKLTRRGGTALEAWELRESGEAVFNRPNATDNERSLGFSRILRAAEKGDARAQYLTGRSLILGEGTVKDEKRGVAFLEKAAQQNIADAIDMLGVCHIRGWGVAIDQIRAANLFKQAVSLDYVPAHFNLGARYAQGKGVPRDAGIAADLFQTGAERGDPLCMFIYARCFDSGFGRKQNNDKALHWIKMSARADHPDALRWCMERDVDFVN